jgi:Ca2+:H+ antiporter
MSLNWLLVFIPIAIGLEHWGVNPIAIFLASAVAIVPLAKLMEQATDALAHYLGPTYGGLLSATIGNAPELIIGITALRHGLIEVLKGSIAGSVMGTLLFGVGVTMISGGLSKQVQRFDRDMVAINSALLIMATFGLIVPSSFHFGIATDEDISIEISVVLLLVYIASMIYTITAKRPTTGKAAVEARLMEAGEGLSWTKKTRQLVKVEPCP